MPVIILNDQNFEEEVMKSDKPVLVDMYAAWCPPCKLMHPIIEEIAEKFADRIKVGKLDVDENGEIAGLYKVESIPVLLIFKDGEIIDKKVGAMSKDDLEEKLNDLGL